MQEQVQQTADRGMEDWDREYNGQGAFIDAECSPAIGKGLAEKISHALFVNFDGLEKMTQKEKRKKLGDLDIVMTGFAGLNGSVFLACRKKEALSRRYPVSFLEEAEKQERLIWQIPEAAPAGKSDDCSTYSFSQKGITGMYLLSRGGVFAGLWDMGKLAGVGLKVDSKKIPVKQETIEICNFFDVNPYQMYSEGCALLLSENGYRLKERLFESGIFSEVIGFTTEDNDRVIINGEEQRFLQKHYEEALDLIGDAGSPCVINESDASCGYQIKYKINMKK